MQGDMPGERPAGASGKNEPLRPDRDGMVEVRAGIMKTKVPLSGLRAPDKLQKRPPREPRRAHTHVQLDKGRKTSMEINLLGYTVEEARNAFDSLYSWMRMRRCRLQPMKDAATTLRNHKEKILAYFYHRITNAVCEGINSMIQAAKRKARGFNTYEGFASMIYLVAGKLQLAVPNPF